MMWPYSAGSQWFWIVMFLVWAAVFACAVVGASVLSRSTGRDTALDTLRQRLAAGQISPEEFERTRRTLQG